MTPTRRVDQRCEPLTVSVGTTATATVINNAADNTTVTGALPWAAGLRHLLRSHPSPATSTPTGTVAYTFFTDGTAPGTGSEAGGGHLDGGVPPTPTPRGPLEAGTYSFQAVFTSGDGNFTVRPATASRSAWIGTSQTATPCSTRPPTPLSRAGAVHGGSAYDTASVTTADEFTPTGTVVYSLFSER